ncbi:hypothetical protein GC176_03315 [bacterium]|nr:hypothetical protein [bacterium]
MNQIIPPSFAFRFAFPVPRADGIPRRGKRLLDLGEEHRIFRPGADFTAAQAQVDVRCGWNEAGLGFAVEVHGKQHPPVSNPDRPDETDGFQLWIHTRSARTIHRANRLCHFFCVLPNGGGDDGLQPFVRQLPVPRASEDAALFPHETFQAATETLDDGYRLEFWLPAETLNGFDPDDSPQLGFYWMLRDSELGDVCLSVDAAFPFASDPSLWETLELAGVARE